MAPFDAPPLPTDADPEHPPPPTPRYCRPAASKAIAAGSKGGSVPDADVRTPNADQSARTQNPARVARRRSDAPTLSACGSSGTRSRRSPRRR